MDFDVSETNLHCGISEIRCISLVIIDQCITVHLVPDLEPEIIVPIITFHITVFCRQHEAILSRAINRAGTLVLSCISGHHQPLITL